ncbi:MAG: hypothetical protein IT529_18000 [Burkholderiales bacterium]|nr:hypothetical protein [Burkholderiales bacterium]
MRGRDLARERATNAAVLVAAARFNPESASARRGRRPDLARPRRNAKALVLARGNLNNMPVMSQNCRVLLWLLLAGLAALMTYVTMSGYLTPDMLFNFANAFYC